MGNAMTPFERACRALCRLEGLPENTIFEGKPMWMSYTEEVRAVLKALEEVSPMQVAAVSVKAAQIGANDIVGIWQTMLDAVEE